MSPHHSSPDTGGPQGFPVTVDVLKREIPLPRPLAQSRSRGGFPHPPQVSKRVGMTPALA